MAEERLFNWWKKLLNRGYTAYSIKLICIEYRVCFVLARRQSHQQRAGSKNKRTTSFDGTWGSIAPKSNIVFTSIMSKKKRWKKKIVICSILQKKEEKRVPWRPCLSLVIYYHRRRMSRSHQRQAKLTTWLPGFFPRTATLFFLSLSRSFLLSFSRKRMAAIVFFLLFSWCSLL